jgi:hypothetical protein
MRVPLWLAAWVIVLAEFVALMWLGWLYSRHAIVISLEKGADVATLVLTAATLVVTGVAVSVGVITIWGFREIRDRAIQAAVEAATKAVSEEKRQAFDQGRGSPSPEEANRIAGAMDDRTNAG